MERIVVFCIQECEPYCMALECFYEKIDLYLPGAGDVPGPCRLRRRTGPGGAGFRPLVCAAGGAGSGTSVQPIGFLVIDDRDVEIVKIDSKSAIEKLIEDNFGGIQHP